MTKLLPTRDYFRNNVALRNDTLLGVCEAIGHDLGFNPNFLRVPLASGIIFAPLVVIGLYLALGVIAFVSRTVFPDRVEKVSRDTAAAEPRQGDNEDVEIARAA